MAKQTLELFDCRVIHGGYKDHEIPKYGITATEIRLLRAMHGEESVRDNEIKPHMVAGKHATIEVDPKMELFDLARRYANTADPMSAKKAIEKAFGTTLIGYDKWVAEVIDSEQNARDEEMRTRHVDSTRRAAELRAKEATEAANALAR